MLYVLDPDLFQEEGFDHFGLDLETCARLSVAGDRCVFHALARVQIPEEACEFLSVQALFKVVQEVDKGPGVGVLKRLEIDLLDGEEFIKGHDLLVLEGLLHSQDPVGLDFARGDGYVASLVDLDVRATEVVRHRLVDPNLGPELGIDQEGQEMRALVQGNPVANSRILVVVIEIQLMFQGRKVAGDSRWRFLDLGEFLAALEDVDLHLGASQGGGGLDADALVHQLVVRLEQVAVVLEQFRRGVRLDDEVLALEGGGRGPFGEGRHLRGAFRAGFPGLTQ